MTRYLIKLKNHPQPLELCSENWYHHKIPLGVYYNWFRQFNDWEWIKKV